MEGGKGESKPTRSDNFLTEKNTPPKMSLLRACSIKDDHLTNTYDKTSEETGGAKIETYGRGKIKLSIEPPLTPSDTRIHFTSVGTIRRKLVYHAHVPNFTRNHRNIFANETAASSNFFGVTPHTK